MLQRIILTTCLSLWPMVGLAGNWPGWRGPDATGVTAELNLPLHWSGTQNVRWKAPLPDEGNSTPIVWGDRVFVTQASEKVDWPPPGAGGPASAYRRSLLCFSRADGKILHLAGLLGSWEGQHAATILTTTPNSDIVALHNRMPVALNDDDAATWVLEDLSLEQITEFLKPCPDRWLQLAPASPLVNDVRNQGPELLDPRALPPQFQLDLMPPA